MTVAMRVMSAGAAYRYLLKSVVVGDGSRDMTAPLIRYYTEKGAPPGRWFGSGVEGLAAGRIHDGEEVTETQLRRLLGEGRDPDTGMPLGRTHHSFAPRLDGSPRRRAVAGYDHTFSIPKSLSTIWAVADAGTQSLIARAHGRDRHRPDRHRMRIHRSADRLNRGGLERRERTGAGGRAGARHLVQRALEDHRDRLPVDL